MPHDTERTNWPLIFWALTGGILGALHVGKIPAAIPVIREDLGLSLVTAGFVISMFNLLGMCLAALVGTAAERIGRRRMAGWGILCLIAGGALGALSWSLPPLLLSRALEGIGFIALAVAMPGVVTATALPRDRALALAIWSVFTPAGFALALLVTPFALPLIGWRGYWWAIAGLTAGLGLLVMNRLAAAPGSARSPGTAFGKLREVVVRLPLLLLSLAFAGYTFQWVTLMAWLPTFLLDTLAFGLVASAVATAVIVAANVPGNLLGGFLMRRGVGAGRLIAAGSLAMALCVALVLPPLLPAWAKLILCFAFSFFGGMIPASLFASVPAASPSPDHLGPANGVLMQLSAAGQFVGPPVIAAAVTAAGGAWSGAILPMAVAAGVAALSGALAMARLRRG